jgi:Arc/MetJ-type ribon-helix-helix transcriptional regulator
MTQVAVRLPDDLLERLERLVGTAHDSRSELIRRAIELYLSSIECEHDARVYERQPLTEAELALADDPDAWKDMPAW